MIRINHRLRILHVILAIKPTNCQYNEHCLPMLHKRDITICTFFKSEITPPAGITLFSGDSTLVGFHRALLAAFSGSEYDIIHVHTPHAGVLLLATLFLAGLYSKLIPSSVHTVHNSFQNFKLRNKLMFLPSFIFFRRLVFCSYSAYDSFPAFYKWLGGNRMHVIQNAVDLDRIDRILKWNQSRATLSGQFTIATVGLIKMKNPLTVLEAFRQSSDEVSQLVFIGEGKPRPMVAQEVDQSGLHNQVRMTGLIGRDSVFEYFAQADVYVSASWGEGLPVAVLEAMACRNPVILSDIPPHREIAVDSDFIPLVKPGDAAGFAREIHKFREMSTAERAKIGQNCRKLIEERFSLPAMHAGYEEVYRQIVGTQLGSIIEAIG
ncbi:MAG TPA: glycosyltransferase family 4 protein [Anaerolineales bacterium]|nr:glycosyltransferase family 4 protein [Anaerolineales bacterium]